jgi:hypothetical protein
VSERRRHPATRFGRRGKAAIKHTGGAVLVTADIESPLALAAMPVALREEKPRKESSGTDDTSGEATARR